MKSDRFTSRWDPEQLLLELINVRMFSMEASRQNDFRAVARLTSEASRLNRAIQEVDGDGVLASSH